MNQGQNDEQETVAFGAAPAVEIEYPGSFIGRYQLVRKIGEGGMGTVYLAQQTEPIRRDVALKIVKPGMDSKEVIARFETERQALALMDHPNIARVLDAGATPTGRPYFVMEYVNGVSITRYCNAKRLGIRERLELFVPVCQAIQHAHQKGVIHRDIKPSNIIVAEQDRNAAPKVIDFGIAKAIGQQLTGRTMFTHVGTIIGTPDYMSPEQAELGVRDIDTRSVIYSLGAVLYELLTDLTPLGVGRSTTAYTEILRRIREEDPPAPSTRVSRAGDTLKEISSNRGTEPARLPKQLQGELDWIVMKALDKERNRRYQTANAFVRDLERYLSGEPVDAGPPSTTYRLRKFVSKHRVWIGVAASFTALLIAGVIFSTWMALRASRAEKIARTVNEFLTKDLLAQASTMNQSEPDPDIKVRTVLDRAAGNIEGRFQSEPEIEAAIKNTVGAAYSDLGLYPEAARQLQSAIDIRRKTLGPEHVDTLASMGQLAALYRDQGRMNDAERLEKTVLEGQRRTLGPEHPNTFRTMDALQTVYLREGKFVEAEAVGRQALDGLERKLGPEDPDSVSAMSDLASVYTEEGKNTLAEPLFKKALAISRKTRGPDHPVTLSTMSDLSVLYSRQKRYPEAEALTSQVLQGTQRTLGPEHPATLKVMSNLAVTYSDDRKYAESEALNRKTLELSKKILGPEHPSTLIVMNNLGVAWKSMGKYAEAESLDNQMLEIAGRTLGAEHPITLSAKANLATDYFYEGKYKQAESGFRELLEIRKRQQGPEGAGTLRATYQLALTLYSTHRYQEAEPLLRESLGRYAKNMPDSWERFRCQVLLGDVLAAEHQYGQAEAFLTEGAEGLLKRESTIQWYGVKDPGQALQSVVHLYEAWGKPDKADEWRSKVRARTVGRAL
jgi:non-specific serine/threonine protein kinase/serine/threonine-protein kinase